MQVLVTARHFELSPAQRVHAEEAVENVAARVHRPHRADVVFDKTHGQFAVEIRFHTVNSKVFTCKAEADDERSALDRAIAKLQNHFDKEPLKRPPKTDRAAG